MNPRRTHAILLLALLLATGFAPTVDAWHPVPDAEETGLLEPPPPLPEEDTETGVIPVDRELERVPRTVHTVNEGVNTTYRVLGDTLDAVEENATRRAQIPVTLMRDGAGGRDAADPHDRLEGGFSAAQTVGEHPWNHTGDAAYRGQAGYTTPRTEDGVDGMYPGHARTLLVTPELDLRTHALLEPRTAGGGVDASQSTTLKRLYWACDAAAVAAGLAGSGLETNLFPVCLAYRDMLDLQDTAASLEYRMRYNLGLGNDGVAVMVFTQEPTVDVAEACTSRPGVQGMPPSLGNSTQAYPPAPPCRIVLPAGGYSPNEVRAMPGRMAYTGYSGWVEDAIDLTPWEGERSVWVGFHFASPAIFNPTLYFQSEDLFPNPDAGFFGFQVDDLEVKAPAAPVNLNARTLLEPTRPVVNGVPTLHPDAPTPVRAHVANLGSTAANVTVVTRILFNSTSDPSLDRSVAATAPNVTLNLPPGRVLEIEHVFDADTLDVGRYTAQVCVHRSGNASVESDDAFCDEPPERGACSGDALNADPCAQVVETPRFFEVRPVQAIQPGAIAMGQDRIGKDDSTTVRFSLRNGGNQEETLHVQMHHVALADPSGLDQSLLPEAQRAPVPVTLEPGESADLTWDVAGDGNDGQYRFVALVNSTGTPQPGFDHEHDLLPSVIKPWRTTVFQGEDITVDGSLEEDAWLELQDHILGTADRVFARVGNNDTHLIIGLVNVSADGVALFLNDGDDGNIASGGGGVGVIVDGNGASGLRYNGTAWVDNGTLTQAVTGQRAAYAPLPENNVYELRIPINETPQGLHAGPGEAVGMLLRFCGNAAQLTCAHFPQGAPLHDGAGFHSPILVDGIPTGDLEDELRQWHTLRLGDPAQVLAGGVPYAEAVAGPGFGVGADQPPYLLADFFRECPDFRGWAQEHAGNRRGVETWTCETYADDDQEMLFLGAGPGFLGASLCGGAPCPPYVRSSGTSSLWTPPIEIPADATAPAAVLSHQYSTSITIDDKWLASRQYEREVSIRHTLNVSLEQWDAEAGRWIDRGPLEPRGGYPTEKSTGILNPDVSPREFKGPGVTTNGEGTQFLSTWWRPQGNQTFYLAPDTIFPTPTSFEGGSPWTTDVIPLHGIHFGGTLLDPNPLQKTLDLRGETVRFRLSHQATGASAPDYDEDWGWRVGGLAVLDDDAFKHDVAVESADLVVGYDPSEHGVGPGTTVPVNVTVRNRGLVEASGIPVDVKGIDLLTGSVLCDETSTLETTILAGQARSVILDCPLPDDPGALVAFVASTDWSGDGFAGNDQQRVRGHFPLAAFHDAAVFVDVSITDAAAGTERSLQIQVQNLGNVPLDDFNVTWQVFDISDPSGAPGNVIPKNTCLIDGLALGTERVALHRTDLTGALVGGTAADTQEVCEDPAFTPTAAGTYIVKVQLEIPGVDSGDLSRPGDDVRLLATRSIYVNGFDGDPDRDPELLEGNLSLPADGASPWSVVETGGTDGSAYLRAGDPALGEIPPGTDTVLELPELDLSALRGATLSFQHRYDLEAGFDAARVEMSTDGGETWEPMVPRPKPLEGLPDGHPSTPLVGANGILGEAVECPACAYTGRSGDLSEDGWLEAEYEFGRQPRFYRDAPVDAFPLDGLEPHADEPTPDGVGFLHDSWILAEPNAQASQRFWWILNATADPEKSGGWHVNTTVEGPPGEEEVPAWRFFDEDAGDDGYRDYPIEVDSRLVTPVVDLRSYGGDAASLRFDHRYEFDGYHDYLQFGLLHLGMARDGGAVAYQVFDEATGEFGSWQLLGADMDASPLGRRIHPNEPNANRGELLMPFPTIQKEDRYALGYPSMALRGGAWTFPTGPGMWENVNHFIPEPIAYVFSGDSKDLHPDTDGWERIDWDVSPLIGERVRFAFHAWTATTEFCRPNQFGQEDYPTCPQNPPLDGWTVTNVGIHGQQYQGEPVQIRFRVATDGSMPKGSWSIDDIQIVGQRYEKGVLVRPDTPDLLDVPDADVSLEGSVRNVGSEDRNGLVLAVEASKEVTDPNTGDPERVAVPFDLVLPDLDGVDGDKLPSEVPAAWGPFDLASSDRLPIRVDLTLPEGEAEVHVRVLECVETDATGECLAYGPVRNEQGAGLPATTWTLVGASVTDPQLVPPLPGRPALAATDPAVPAANETISLEAALHNNGTTAPGLEATWTVQRLERKGCRAGQPCDQPHTIEVVGDTWTLDPVALAPARDETLPFAAAFTPPEEGLYRATLEVRDGSGVLHDGTASEFLAGEVRPYYRIDFAQTPAGEGGWEAVPTDPSTSPPEVDFRQVGDTFLWGVSPQEQLGGLDYCYAGGCNPPGSNGGPPLYGLQGAAVGPHVDLGRVVEGQAILSVRHAHGFTEGDGAVVEALPLRSPVGSTDRPAFECVEQGSGDRDDAWFRLAPMEDLRGETRSYAETIINGGRGVPPYTIRERASPLGVSDVIGGQPGVDDELLRFPLHDGLEPVCPLDEDEETWTLEGDPPPSLANYTVRLRLQVGTTPGINDPNCNPTRCPDNGPDGQGREGALGWYLDTLAATSVDVEVTPGAREVPVRDGYPKRFNMQVTNHGPLEETFRIGLGSEEAFQADPDWFAFPTPNVTLAPGETRTVPFEVSIPADAGVERGRHTAHLRATSTLDPSTHGQALVVVRLPENNLPDLDTQILAVEAETPDEPLEPGKVAQVATNIQNLGQVASEDVPVRIEAVHLNANGTEEGRSRVGTYDLPALDSGESHTNFMEWVPKAAGLYRIEVVADPDGRLIETGTSNNKPTALVEVVPLQRPDLRIADLRLEGVAPDGYAPDGGLVTIVANVTNRGAAPGGAFVDITAGSATLLEKDLGTLGAGQHREASTLRIVSEGETKIRATVYASEGGGEPHQLSRILRVRGIDLAFEPEPGRLDLVPGGTATTRVHVNNTGNAVERVVFSMDPAHPGWGLAAIPNPVTVGPGSVAWSTLTLRASTEAAAGEYNLTLLASTQSRPDSSQVVRVPVRVAEHMDAPAVVVENTTAGPGGSSELLVRVASRSNTPQNVTVILAEPDWATGPHNVSLAANAETLVDLPVVVPAHTLPGTAPTRVVVQDVAGSVLAEARGSLKVTSHVAADARWGARSVAPSEDLSSRVFQVALNVTNAGNVPIEVEATVTELSDGAQAPQPPTVRVEPGKSRDLPVKVRVSPEFSERVEGRVDVQMRTNDSAAPTRFATLDLPDLAALSDLAVTDITVTPRGAVAAGDTVRMVVTVENLGFVEATATELFTYVDGDAVGVHAVEALPPGAKARINLTGTFPASGGYLVHVVADGPDAVEELHEDNNGGSREMAVEAGDLLQKARETPAPAGAIVVPLVLLAACLWIRRGRR